MTMLEEVRDRFKEEGIELTPELNAKLTNVAEYYSEYRGWMYEALKNKVAALEEELELNQIVIRKRWESYRQLERRYAQLKHAYNTAEGLKGVGE